MNPTQENIERIKKIISLRNEQINYYEEMIKPLHDNIKLAKQAIKNEIPIEVFNNHCWITNKYIKQRSKI